MNKNGQKPWYKIAESIVEIKNVMGNPCLVKIAGKELCISVVGEIVNACSARCPHAGGKLHEGYLDAKGQLVCPLHKYRFDPTTGRNTSGEGYCLMIYPVKIDPDEIDGGVFVSV